MKYVNLEAIDLRWRQIGASPFRSSYGGSFTQAPMACIVNGNFSLFYATATNTNPHHYAGAVLYSWAENGDMCTYRTSSFINNGFFGDLVNPQTVFQNANVFSFSYADGGVWQFICPNIFIPGGELVIPDQRLQTFSPCGIHDFSGNIYCSQQDLYCQEFIQDFPLSTNYWASIFDGQHNLIGSGFIGNAFEDLFNRVSTSLPPFTTTNDLFYKNGFNFYSNMGNAGNIYQAVGFNQPFLNGDPTTLVCGAPAPTVFVSGIKQFQAYPYRDNGCPAFSTNSIKIAGGITDVPGFFCLPDTFRSVILSQDYFIGLKNLSNGNQDGFALLSNQDRMYSHVFPGNHHAGQIYIADTRFSSFNIGPLPIVQRAQYNGLANYHRAVSPNKLFQA